MPKQAEWVSDVEFVLSECIRIKEITAVGKPRDWVKQLSKDDLLCHLPRSDGQGFIICGTKAQSRLRRLATIALRHSDALGTVQADKVYASLRKLIPERFIFGKYEVTQQTVEKTMATAVKEAKKGRSDIKHFIPCRLMYATEPDSFKVGPVTFKTLPAFKRDMSPLFEAYLDSAKTEPPGARDPCYLSEAQHYYDGFSWVAEVEVLKCDEFSSKERATLAVTAALDILHIIFGAFYTERMMIAGPRMETDNRAHITVRANLGLHAWLSSTATSEVGFGKDWCKFLEQPDAVYQLTAAERIIEPIVNPDVSLPLGLKVADAAAWFGLAVREQTDASRIVKAITALERLVLTDEQEKLAETISQRAAAICCNVRPTAQFHELAVKLKKAYDLRSRLVHGSLSPFDPEVQEGVTGCLLLCADVLRAGLVFFSFHRLLEKPISNKELSAAFSRLVDYEKTKG